MMGKLIWLMGPSGSGKDSLLAELRLREQTQLLVAHRYITRDASAGSENHIALSEREFFTRAGQNLLALSWHANGLYYGVGIEIDLWLHAGFDVVVNGSRAHLPQARARYQSALLPVCLQVSPEILRQRWKTVAVKTPVKLTPGARRPILHRIAIRSTMTAACASRSTRC
ncbi:hypothetical protein ECZU28_25760 [Escherichia coli]|nr:hypothetical protein ECZU28_25760 [Escherichia coli]